MLSRSPNSLIRNCFAALLLPFIHSFDEHEWSTWNSGIESQNTLHRRWKSISDLHPSNTHILPTHKNVTLKVAFLTLACLPYIYWDISDYLVLLLWNDIFYNSETLSHC